MVNAYDALNGTVTHYDDNIVLKDVPEFRDRRPSLGVTDAEDETTALTAGGGYCSLSY